MYALIIDANYVGLSIGWCRFSIRWLVRLPVSWLPNFGSNAVSCSDLLTKKQL